MSLHTPLTLICSCSWTSCCRDSCSCCLWNSAISSCLWSCCLCLSVTSSCCSCWSWWPVGGWGLLRSASGARCVYVGNCQNTQKIYPAYYWEARGLAQRMWGRVSRPVALGEVGEPGRRRAAAGEGGENGPLHAGPWEGWLCWLEAPAWAVLLCSRPLKIEGSQKGNEKGHKGGNKGGMKNIQQ